MLQGRPGDTAVQLLVGEAAAHPLDKAFEGGGLGLARSLASRERERRREELEREAKPP